MAAILSVVGLPSHTNCYGSHIISSGAYPFIPTAPTQPYYTVLLWRYPVIPYQYCLRQPYWCCHTNYGSHITNCYVAILTEVAPTHSYQLLWQPIHTNCYGSHIISSGTYPVIPTVMAAILTGVAPTHSYQLLWQPYYQ
ncbi:Hypothetical predicted protein [Pelobates cultripes]|uniref:Uncharacterized protein n=1 Tax=Pelobates cultripes TaxID=61616 RepID=A0AAD1T3D0_PELCU|nr:Hypothetical predicted protein [Pelobates cultripes]